jgi:exoribonuclease-2
MPQVARGAQVKLDVLRWDEVDLSIEARLLEIAALPDGATELEDEEPDESEESSGADQAEATGEEAAPEPEAGAEAAEVAAAEAGAEPAGD